MIWTPLLKQIPHSFICTYWVVCEPLMDQAPFRTNIWLGETKILQSWIEPLWLLCIALGAHSHYPTIPHHVRTTVYQKMHHIQVSWDKQEIRRERAREHSNNTSYCELSNILRHPRRFIWKCVLLSSSLIPSCTYTKSTTVITTPSSNPPWHLVAQAYSCGMRHTRIHIRTENRTRTQHSRTYTGQMCAQGNEKIE